MPQMAPIYWLKLTIMFILMLLITTTMIYFMMTFEKKSITTNSKTPMLSLKW